MGKRSEEALKEIEETREALGQKVDSLVGQVKQTAETAGKKGIKVGAIVLGAIVGIIALRKIRNRR